MQPERVGAKQASPLIASLMSAFTASSPPSSAATSTACSRPAVRARDQTGHWMTTIRLPPMSAAAPPGGPCTFAAQGSYPGIRRSRPCLIAIHGIVARRSVWLLHRLIIQIRVLRFLVIPPALIASDPEQAVTRFPISVGIDRECVHFILLESHVRSRMDIGGTKDSRGRCKYSCAAGRSGRCLGRADP